jgi:hypothetical protein
VEVSPADTGTEVSLRRRLTPHGSNGSVSGNGRPG